MSSQILQVREATRRARNLLLSRAREGSLVAYAHHVNDQYVANWHHVEIMSRIERFIKSDKAERLMLFMPPQHGKSEIASKMAPSFALGLNPNLSIAACSYAADLSRKFNREVQRLMDSPAYGEIFPRTRLNGQRVADDSRGDALRNTHEFEIVGYRGSYKAVGIGGGLSGRKVDLAIIDDPVKDAKEAYSEVIREGVWDWYLSVLNARLHNKSKVLLIMTRWHEDDLAGRLLKNQPEQWEVISLPAIREEGGHEWDPRPIGAALWPDRHSLDRLREIEKISALWFASLYQQRPSPKGGGLLKGKWFRRFRPSETPPGPVKYFIDTAYTKKTKNDYSAIIAYKVYQGKLYILNVTRVKMEFPQLCKFVVEYVNLTGYDDFSTILVEPKASGQSLVQQLQESTDLNIDYAISPKDDKEARVAAISHIPSSGRVYVVQTDDQDAQWYIEFVQECEGFPNVAHDDMVDCLEGAITNDLINVVDGPRPIN